MFVYADKGYSAAEVGDIAAKTGLARGLMYHYVDFPHLDTTVSSSQ
ncbi:TetR/AcrR family transcriptional regulator [Paenibacillus popilliae]|nr:TetR/AcrR family transcriptional regulator [Paenibacillus sp. SDF0028]